MTLKDLSVTAELDGKKLAKDWKYFTGNETQVHMPGTLDFGVILSSSPDQLIPSTIIVPPEAIITRAVNTGECSTDGGRSYQTCRLNQGQIDLTVLIGEVQYRIKAQNLNHSPIIVNIGKPVEVSPSTR